jgi:hypothetical protein
MNKINIICSEENRDKIYKLLEETYIGRDYEMDSKENNILFTDNAKYLELNTEIIVCIEESEIYYKKEKITRIYKSTNLQHFRQIYCFENTMPKIEGLASCVCPTSNRERFINNLIENYVKQDYKNKELIILDDSNTDETEKIINNIDKIKNNIRYIKLKGRYDLGKKRNILNQLANGSYIVCMDDDDYYPVERISHSVNSLEKNNKKIAGCSELYILYDKLNKIYKFGPYGKNHGTCGTFSYKVEYLMDHCFEDFAKKHEESYFTKKFKEDMLQMNPFKTILCISHDSNTFDKKKIIKNGKITNLSIMDWK